MYAPLRPSIADMLKAKRRLSIPGGVYAPLRQLIGDVAAALHLAFNPRRDVCALAPQGLDARVHPDIFLSIPGGMYAPLRPHAHERLRHAYHPCDTGAG